MGLFIIYFVTTTGAHRPREHTYNSYTGKAFQGSDAKFSHHVIPNDVRHLASLKCRKCDDFTVPYEEERMMCKKKVAAFRKFAAHEKKCGGKKKT